MPKRILVAVIFIALAAQRVSAQQPQVQRQKVAPPEMARLKAAVTVIDLRNVIAEKKPPKREADATYSLRMMSGGKTGSAVAALPPAQLSEALKGAGLSLPPPNVYARFMPGQANVPGKGYMYLLAPDWVYPDHIQFYSSDTGAGYQISNGAMVVLREPGTYVFDFLVEFTSSNVGTFYECEVLIGHQAYQIQALEQAGGPQHILVIWPLDQAMMSLRDEQRSVGIHCYRSRAGEQAVPWTLYLVDVTKL